MIFFFFSIGYPVVTLGYGVKSYVGYKMRQVSAAFSMMIHGGNWSDLFLASEHSKWLRSHHAESIVPLDDHVLVV